MPCTVSWAMRRVPAGVGGGGDDFGRGCGDDWDCVEFILERFVFQIGAFEYLDQGVQAAPNPKWSG